jgi:hypothetical protein
MPTVRQGFHVEIKEAAALRKMQEPGLEQAAEDHGKSIASTANWFAKATIALAEYNKVVGK